MVVSTSCLKWCDVVGNDPLDAESQNEARMLNAVLGKPAAPTIRANSVYSKTDALVAGLTAVSRRVECADAAIFVRTGGTKGAQGSQLNFDRLKIKPKDANKISLKPEDVYDALAPHKVYTSACMCKVTTAGKNLELCMEGANSPIMIDVAIPTLADPRKTKTVKKNGWLKVTGIDNADPHKVAKAQNLADVQGLFQIDSLARLDALKTALGKIDSLKPWCIFSLGELGAVTKEEVEFNEFGVQFSANPRC